ncbi:protein adenylyltransferase SelO [Teredinibacter purpureus]|uniref:protein adenylyltransferase SelO n=1 Tax=Teredinibacter purpureus TaxID=2731756 RepID=UPI0005F8493F|nr:YdiU family protein [Teredinibacter purpureus]
MQFLTNFHQLGDKFSSPVTPRGLTNPSFVITNLELSSTLSLKKEWQQQAEYLQLFSGNHLSTSASPLAMVYAGHQFGGYSSQLGDGRGVLLGEVSTPIGLRDIHLKGAGTTPFSRFGDGYAVLRSCIREYLASGAMKSLNIPTTEALCIVRGDNPVQREIIEPAAILTRVAKSHIRFGHFEYFHYTQQFEQVKTLADYCVNHYLPEHANNSNKYEMLLQMSTLATAKTIGLWQAEGFSHGVLNTDNMSIVGETLDYGPFGFMEAYDPGYICNHSDTEGRYAFDQQPSVGLWNLNALAFAMSSLVDRDVARDILMQYQPALRDSYNRRFGLKLGIKKLTAEHDSHLHALFKLLEENAIDYARFFRGLSHLTNDDWLATLLSLSDNTAWKTELPLWLNNHQENWNKEGCSRQEIEASMLSRNPKFMLRNYLAEQAIREAYSNNYSELERLILVLSDPYNEHSTLDHYADTPPDWAKNIQVSCSS